MQITRMLRHRADQWFTTKTLRIMKLSAILLLAAALQVSAGINAQTVSYSGKEVPLKTVLTVVEKQTGFFFVINGNLLAKAKPVTVDAHDMPLNNFLKLALKDQALDFTIEGRTIVLSSSSPRHSSGNSMLAPESLPPVEVKVVDSLGHPLSGATITIKNSKVSGVTDAEGIFSLNVAEGDVLLVSYVGYETRSVIVTPPMLSSTNNLIITLRPSITKLEEIQVSSGYQYIPKERATGSFDFVDNKTFNRTVSSDLLSRLNGVTNGMLFSAKAGNGMQISIRGRSTLFSNTQPLVVLDNFPYEGRIEDLNPNDIENITLLKDAAAASIWGTRAGNGVLVITTKRGKQNRPPQVSFNTNVTVTGKPDLHYEPRMGTADYIDAERFLFGKGYYDVLINRRYAVISPVVNILARQRAGQITEAEANAQIDQLSRYDILSDMENYLYQNGVDQQYQVNISGGSMSHTYYLSAGFDKKSSTSIGNGSERYTLKANNTFHGLKQRLQLSTDFNFISSKIYGLGGGYSNPQYPYLRLADENGNATEVSTNGTLNSSYTDTAGGGYLLDWKYRPLDELRNRSVQNNSNVDNFIINLNLSYKILKPLTFTVYYQYNKTVQSAETYNDETSYYTRNQINTFSQINRQTGVVTRPIPLGGIINSSVYENGGSYGRAQLNFQESWGSHKLTGIAGYEAQDIQGSSKNLGNRYGYNRANETFQNKIDDVTLFRNYYSGSTASISTGGGQSSRTNRSISYYSNLGYVYDERFLASASFRKDESNIFGVSANQRGVPLWSAGLGWNIHNEKFYHARWLPYLKLRATFGYNGNVDNSTSAYLTARSIRTNLWLNQFSEVVNPPNPSLRWERVQNINAGLDFGTKNNRLSGSIEYYIKNGQDLMGYSPVAPQTGITLFYGNVANTSTKGLDFKLSSINITSRTFAWESTLIVNFNKDKVTKYLVNPGNNGRVISSSAIVFPIVGKPILGIVGFQYGGLSSEGNPIGVLDGKSSEDYTAMINSSDRNNLNFHGSANPTSFGSLRNTFRYRSFEFSFNILYKAGYYFRRSSFMSNNLIGGEKWIGVGDYNQRWQQPGDEAHTQVPKLLYPYNTNRDLFYGYSSYLVEDASHIRLHDIQLNYQWENGFSKNGNKFFKNLNLYAYASNIGILWKANKVGLDPSSVSSPPAPLTMSIGMRASF